MKLLDVCKFCLVISLFLFSCAQSQTISDAEFSQIKKLYEDGEFFQLRDALSAIKNLDRSELYYYNAVVNTAFNKPAKSAEYLDGMMNSGIAVSDSLMGDALYIKANNMARLGEYRKAHDTFYELIESYASAMDSSSLASAKNEIKIWKSLLSTDKMEVTSTGNTTVPFVKDKAGLDRLPVHFGEKTENFVFDSGANYSTIQRSTAIDLGMTILDANFNVQGFTGQYVQSDLAVAEELTIGNHKVTNVIFLVFDDDVLTFPQVDYKIEGIIGFPVLDAVGEIRINQKKEKLEIPERANNYATNNLALAGLTPLLQVEINDEVLLCYFDTGATNTDLLNPYYEKYKSEIDNSGYEQKDMTSGGAGGTKTVKGYVIPALDIRVGNNQTTLENVSLFTEELVRNESRYANLGQDLIGQFDVLILNLKSMSLLFE